MKTLMTPTSKPMMILIAGPYRSGTPGHGIHWGSCGFSLVQAQ